MCGIAGYAGRPRSPSQMRADVKAMCDAIRHRGPDDYGAFVAEGVALGMRRLSIIDLATGQQPIRNEDGTVTLVFNGEIYNYRDLTRRLIDRGHRFTSVSDTETLAHLYEDLGVGLVHELNGMFAFAIWDSERSQLLLARDRLGIKPLYFWPSEGGVAFASELKSFLALDDFVGSIEPEAMAYYLALGYVPEPLSIYRGVRKLEPGQLLTWSAGEGIRVERYWSPVVEQDPEIGPEEAVEAVRELLEDAVRARLVADVPLGAFLSGGIDSSAVVATMARLMDRPVKTFSIGFEEPEFNEAGDARIVADALGTDHTELIVRPDVDTLIERVATSFDEPFSDSSAIPTFLVSELARQHVTVSLSGDGGDELFGGYTRYASALRRNHSLPSPLRSLLGAVGRALPQGALGRRRILEYSRTERGRYAGMVASPLDPGLGGLARPEIAGLLPDLDGLLGPWFDRVGPRDYGSRIMLVDTMTYLPGDILTKVDRMSMAVSLEARVPMFDHRMVELACRLPTSLKIRGEGKWVLRRAMQDALPAHVFRKRKQGFGVPLASWFRRELRYRVDALLDPAGAIHEFVDPVAVQRVAREHARGRRDHSATLWRLLVLSFFLASSRDHPRGAGNRALAVSI